MEKAVAILGKDGSLALMFRGGESIAGAALIAEGAKIGDYQEFVLEVRRLERSGTKEWSAVLLSANSEGGRSYNIQLRPEGGFISGNLPEWKSLGNNFTCQYPAVFKIRRWHDGDLTFFCGDKRIFHVAEPAGKPFDGLSISVAGQSREDATLVELSSAKMVCIRRTPPAAPPASAFPKIVISHSMYWSAPNFYHAGLPARGYENGPLIPELPGDEGGWDGQFFRDAKEAGVGAVAFCSFDVHADTSYLYRKAESARKSGSGVMVLPCMDNMGKAGRTFLRDFWEDERLRTHPNVLRVGDCPVVLTYNNHGAEVWKERLDLVEKAGGRFVIITDICGVEVATLRSFPEERYRDEVALLDGLYFFASKSVGFQPAHTIEEHRAAQRSSTQPPLDGTGIGPAITRFGHSFPTPKIIGGSVTPGYIGTTRVGNVNSPRGTFLYRLNWLEAIREDFDFVHITTDNDYTEATETECSVNATFAFIDLNRYFGTRWKTGQWPKLEKPEAILSYRKAISKREKAEFELVLLRPEITGAEPKAEIANRFSATCIVKINDTEEVKLPAAAVEVWPGHLVWRFWSDAGLDRTGTAEPYVRIVADGAPVQLPIARTAPFALLDDGEFMSRKWLNVPLHRLAASEAEVIVQGQFGDEYPRTARVNGLDWDNVMGGSLELHPNPLIHAISAETIRDGFTEEFISGAGNAPMRYADGWIKRCVVDTNDRYTAVIRMKDNTFAYPKPLVVPAPRPDASTVMDVIVSPTPVKVGDDEFLADRGPLRRNLALPKKESPERPVISRDAPGCPWFIRFDGVKNQLTMMGALNVPPGPATLEMWIRPRSVDKAQTIFDSWGMTLTIRIDDDGRLSLCRTNQARVDILQQGKAVLEKDRWQHLVAVFDGMRIQLYLNGKADGQAAECHGVKTEGRSMIGPFHGDMAAFRLLQRPMSPEEIKSRFDRDSKRFVTTTGEK